MQPMHTDTTTTPLRIFNCTSDCAGSLGLRNAFEIVESYWRTSPPPPQNILRKPKYVIHTMLNDEKCVFRDSCSPPS